MSASNIGECLARARTEGLQPVHLNCDRNEQDFVNLACRKGSIRTRKNMRSTGENFSAKTVRQHVDFSCGQTKKYAHPYSGCTWLKHVSLTHERIMGFGIKEFLKTGEASKFCLAAE